MQQYYPNNVDGDPSRDMWNNSSNYIKENNNKNIFKKIIEDNKKNKNDLRDVFYNNNNQENSIQNDIIEKDKEIQSLNFKLKQYEIDFNKLKKDMSIIDDLKNEIKVLNNKLKEEYEKNREISILKNKVEMLEMQNKLLNKNKVNLNEEEGKEETNSEEAEDIKTEDYDYNKVFQQLMKDKEKYKNEKLKGIICKYKPKADKSKIDAIFIEMKIDDNINMTKELIENIILKLNQ